MRRFASLVIGAVFVAIAIMSPASATHVVRISGDTAAAENDPGWMFNRDPTTATPFAFDNAAASTGYGALHVLPIEPTTAADKMVAELFLDSSVADTSLAYDFKIGPGGTAADANEFYLNVYANFGVSDNDKFFDCRYDIVPTIGSTGGFTTVSYDPTLPYPVTTRGGASASPYTCPAVPAEMDLLSPDSNVRALALNVGDTSAGDAALDGFLDNVVVTNDGTTTTYDFEPAPAIKDDCKKGGYANYGFANQGQCIRFVNTGEDSRG